MGRSSFFAIYEIQLREITRPSMVAPSTAMRKRFALVAFHQAPVSELGQVGSGPVSPPSGRTALLAGIFCAPDCGDAQPENADHAELEAARRVGRR